jgi:glutamate-ammonia-ligase adenylyltransferase
VLPKPLARTCKRSAAPEAASVTLERLAESRPGEIERLVAGSDVTPLGRSLVAVVAASRSLSRLCLVEPAALDVLDDLDHPVAVDTSCTEALVRSKRLELLRIAATDLLDMARLEEVGAALARLADHVLEGALKLADEDRSGLAVIGMGKLGGRELNYASDVDVLFVTSEAPQDERARRMLGVARKCFRVDTNLRPHGRSGPLTRSVEGYRIYWEQQAATWELQALIKARPVAGDVGLGRAFAETAAGELWGRPYGADELAEVRRMKARAERFVARRGLSASEIKRGPGGIRDVEFAVQLLQLVHGRHDPGIRDASTLGALSELSEAGYIGTADAVSFADAYRFLRAVEHRLQLVEEEQTHQVPTEAAARQHLARVLGFRDTPSSTAADKFGEALRSYQREVRAVHERLFFRPLLETFAALDLQGRDTHDAGQALQAGDATIMEPGAVAQRLAAFGFADLSRTRAAVSELAGGLTRSSRLMVQMLPLLLDWLSVTPDPDLGLLGLRNLVFQAHQRARMVETFRESPEAARRLCLLLGSSRVLAEYVSHNPELIGSLGDDDALSVASRDSLVAEAQTRVGPRSGAARRRAQLVSLREEQVVKIAARDIFDLDDVHATGAALSSLADALLEAALDAIDTQIPFCIISMGRFGGAELSYASDLDVLFVHDGGGSEPANEAPAAAGEAVAESLLHFVHGPSPAQRVATLDLGLRPEGGQGRLTRDLNGYATYLARWAQTWERQALLRARVVAGDRALAERFLTMVADFIWDHALTEDEVADIRRMKARVERERIPAREDPQFHLKLGRGSLSDVEWTVQLLQLRHGIPGTGTMDTLEDLVNHSALDADDATILRDSYRFCERTRNRWYLIGAIPGGGSPGDALPTEAHRLSRLARSLGTTPAELRDEYRRVTRRARRVMERLFYGIDLRG